MKPTSFSRPLLLHFFFFSFFHERKRRWNGLLLLLLSFVYFFLENEQEKRKKKWTPFFRFSSSISSKKEETPTPFPTPFFFLNFFNQRKIAWGQREHFPFSFFFFQNSNGEMGVSSSPSSLFPKIKKGIRMKRRRENLHFFLSFLFQILRKKRNRISSFFFSSYLLAER